MKFKILKHKIKVKTFIPLLLILILNSLFFSIIYQINFINNINLDNNSNKDTLNSFMKQDFSNNHSIYGIGSQLKTTIKSNKTHLISGTIKDSKLNPDRKFNFEVDNNNWNLTFNNFTIENIKSNSTKYIVDNYPSIFIENNIYNTFVWTSIKIPVNCILNSVEIFVQETNVTNGPAWDILTYNASRDPVTFLVRPDSLISLVSEKIAYNPSIPDLNQ